MYQFSIFIFVVIITLIVVGFGIEGASMASSGYESSLNALMADAADPR